jgi:Flp pilus assembly protein TadD
MAGVSLDPVELDPATAERFDRLGAEFLAEFLGRATARHPENLEALAELATTLTRLGRYAEGLEVDERLVKLAPRDPTVHFNLACSLALCGRPEPALDALERSVELGYADVEHLVGDEDLASVRQEERFRTLVERLRKACT